MMATEHITMESQKPGGYSEKIEAFRNEKCTNPSCHHTRRMHHGYMCYGGPTGKCKCRGFHNNTPCFCPSCRRKEKRKASEGATQ